jgi:hypothetical protein
MYKDLTKSNMMPRKKRIQRAKLVYQMQTKCIAPLYAMRPNDPAARTMNIYLPANAAKSITSSLKHTTQNW